MVMVSTEELNSSTLNQDDQQKSFLNKDVRDSIHIIHSARPQISKLNEAENLTCVNEDRNNYVIPTAVSNTLQSTSTSIEPDDIRLKIVELNKKGLGPVAIARSLGISRQRASRWIRRHEEKNGYNHVKKSPYLFQEKSLNSFAESSLPRHKDNIEQDEENSCITFDEDDVEELQCIDEDSIEVLKSLYMSDDAPPEFLKVIPHEDCIRDQIVSLHKEGLGPTAIARELGITRQRASRWVKRFICEGTIFTKQRIGRPKKLTPDQKSLIRKFMEMKPYATITDVMTAFRLDCSRSTVRSVMKASMWDDVA